MGLNEAMGTMSTGWWVCPQTNCPALPWVGLVLGHVGKMLCMLCHDYTHAETHPHSPGHMKVHLSEHRLSKHSPRTLPPFPCLSRGGGWCPRQVLAPSWLPIT